MTVLEGASAPSNVFVLGTGRCGTKTVAKACKHISNWSAAHESRMRLWNGRLNYPPGHIESDHRLAFFLGPLHDRYPDALYVHLVRGRADTIQSWAARRSPHSLVNVWPQAALFRPRGLSRTDAAVLMVDTVTANLDHFLRDKAVIRMTIESPHDSFDELWDRIGAEGDRKAAHAELDVRHNAR